MSSYHPDGLAVDIVGIIASDHPFCGEIVNLDIVVRFCCEMIWSRIMTKKKECEAAVLAILDEPDSELIAVTLACHRMWKTKKNVTKLKSVNKLINDAQKEDEEIEVKKAASKKKAAEKRKATSELKKAAMTASVAAMASATTPVNLTE